MAGWLGGSLKHVRSGVVSAQRLNSDLRLPPTEGMFGMYTHITLQLTEYSPSVVRVMAYCSTGGSVDAWVGIAFGPASCGRCLGCLQGLHALPLQSNNP